MWSASLAPLQGTKAGITAKYNPVKDSNKRMCMGQSRDMICHPQRHVVFDHVWLPGHCFVVLECAYNDVNEVGLAGTQQQESLISKKVARHIDVVLDSAGLYSCNRNCFPLDEQDGVASKEIVLQCWVWEFYAWVIDVDLVTEGKKVLLPGQASFCRLGSLGSGNFASNSASKIMKTRSALGWNCLHYCSYRKSCDKTEK